MISAVRRARVEVGGPDRVDGVDVRGGVGGLLLAQAPRAEGRPDPASDRRRSTWTRRGAPTTTGCECSAGSPPGRPRDRSTAVSTRRNPSARCPGGSPAASAEACPHARMRSAVPAGSGIWLVWLSKRLDLAVERVGDVDEHRGIRRRHHVDLRRHPRLEPLVEQLGMGEGVAGIRVHGRERRVTAGEMVRVARVDALVVAIGRLAQHPLRAHAPDLAGDVAPQVERRHETAVRVAEEGEIGDADDLRRRGLLDAPEVGELGAGRCRCGGRRPRRRWRCSRPLRSRRRSTGRCSPRR